MSERELKIRLEDKLPEVIKLLEQGKHIEIHLAKDDIRLFAVDKKIVK